MPRAQRASDVGQHDLRGEAALRSASRRDDAVRAEERAAVLDLDEGTRPLDRRPLVDDAFDLDARERGERPRDARVTAPCPGGVARAGPTRRSISASSASFERLSTSRASGSAAANASRATCTEQPVTTTSASGFARRARRTAWRDFWSAVAVTVQVLTRTRSAPATASPSTTRTPRSRSRRAADSISDWLTLQPRFVIAAVCTARAGRAGAVGVTTAGASCS